LITVLFNTLLIVKFTHLTHN